MWVGEGMGAQEIVYSFYDQKGEPGPNYKELHRLYEPVANKKPLKDLKRWVTSGLHFKSTFWQLCGGLLFSR